MKFNNYISLRLARGHVHCPVSVRCLHTLLLSTDLGPELSPQSRFTRRVGFGRREELLLLFSLRQQRHPIEKDKQIWYCLHSRFDLMNAPLLTAIHTLSQNPIFPGCMDVGILRYLDGELSQL